MLMERSYNILTGYFQHIMICPIVVPLIVGSLMLLLSDSKRYTRITISFISIGIQLSISIVILCLAGNYNNSWPNGFGTYIPGNWPIPFGIVLVADRLTAVLLTLTATLGAISLLYASARWDRAGIHFYSLFQFLLMGFNGVFLTGDLFNLFVFFEVLLSASYSLMLHGSGIKRVNAGLHYIVVNLIVSFLLLISISLIYGVTGTLNLAELAIVTCDLKDTDRLLFEIGFAILSIAFMVKAGAWPLNFWLVKGYASASAPIASIFSIMTKIGIYALLRINSILLTNDTMPGFNLEWMFIIGLLTLLFGGLGLLSTQQILKLPGYCIITSTGTMLLILGMSSKSLIGPLLFYLISSVLGISMLILLTELIERAQTSNTGTGYNNSEQNMFIINDPVLVYHNSNIVGVPIPSAMAFLGLTFVLCSLIITGMPPLSGFIAKFSLLSQAISIAETEQSTKAWILIIAILFSGFSTILVFSRIGIRFFWTRETTIPTLHWLEVTPIGILICLSFALMLGSSFTMVYLNDTATFLSNAIHYINAVFFILEI